MLSGDEHVVLELAQGWEDKGRKTKRLKVSHAFHSPRMDGMLEEFAAVARGISYSAPLIALLSNVTGEPVSAELMCDADYWVRHVREPVRLLSGMRWIEAQGERLSFLEVGPGTALSAMAQDCLAGPMDAHAGAGATAGAGTGAGAAAGAAAVVALPLLRAGQPEAQTAVSALAELWVDGVDLSWAALFAESGGKRIELPSYAFQRQRHWIAAPGAGWGRIGGTAHPLLGAGVELADGEGWLFSERLSLDTHSWLGDHGVLGTVPPPATAFLELALRAGEQVGCGELRELVLEAPLTLERGHAVQLQLRLGASQADGARTLGIYARPLGQPDEAWTG